MDVRKELHIKTEGCVVSPSGSSSPRSQLNEILDRIIALPENLDEAAMTANLMPDVELILRKLPAREERSNTEYTTLRTRAEALVLKLSGKTSLVRRGRSDSLVNTVAEFLNAVKAIRGDVNSPKVVRTESPRRRVLPSSSAENFFGTHIGESSPVQNEGTTQRP